MLLCDMIIHITFATTTAGSAATATTAAAIHPCRRAIETVALA